MSRARRDTTFVDLHRVAGDALVVRDVRGDVYRVTDEGEELDRIDRGSTLRVGDTIVLEAGALIFAGALRLEGGRFGKAHAFVPEHAFLSSPRRSDVPRLLEQLTEVARESAALGGDPLSVQGGPETPFERAESAEFAHANLTLEAARRLPEAAARAHGAVCLFFLDETAFVAVSEVSIAKLRALMVALGCPVNPHLVEPEVLERLLDRVYRSGQDLS